MIVWSVLWVVRGFTSEGGMASVSWGQANGLMDLLWREESWYVWCVHCMEWCCVEGQARVQPDNSMELPLKSPFHVTTPSWLCVRVWFVCGISCRGGRGGSPEVQPDNSTEPLQEVSPCHKGMLWAEWRYYGLRILDLNWYLHHVYVS